MNPRAGTPARRNLQECWSIEFGSYELYYVIDDSAQEIRFFDIKRVYHSW